MNPDLLFHLKSLTRCIYYVTEEEDRFLAKLAGVLKKYEDHTFVYNAIFGMVPIKQLIRSWSTRSVPENRDTQNIHDAMAKIYADDPQNGQLFYIITDPERWLPDPQVQRRFLNIFHQLHNDDRTIKIIIFVSNRLVVPPKLQRYIEVIHDKGLTEEEISELIQEVTQKLQIKPTKDVSRVFRGLTSYEADAAIAQSIIKTKRDPSPKRIDPRVIADFKRRQLAKTDLLDYVDVSPFTFDVVGGNDQFKLWADKTKAAWTEEGQRFGLRPPKGVLAAGIWGCGKSLSVKAMGNAWKLPVIQLEMGRLRSSAVGESEANVYRAINLIESVAPCVTGDTEVTLADGSTRPIEDLWQELPDDLEVMCWNEKTLKVETTKVAAITRREAEAFRVEAANGFRLDATANHHHYVMRSDTPEWIRTDELKIGDKLAVPQQEDGSQDLLWVGIQNVSSIGEHVVYDLACEGQDTHSFFANGLVTHNCVVWLDEAEKSLSGGQSSAMSDAGTTSRVIGILSNWLQETTAQVCLAMTANSLKTLPVEFVNRMDERFFFDLPSDEERVEILKIHLQKRGQNPDEFQLADLAEHAVNMVGREIEQAIGAALIESFHAGCDALSPELLAKELQSKPRIFKTMVDELKEVLDWVGFDPILNEGIRARFASNRRSETFKNFQP